MMSKDIALILIAAAIGQWMIFAAMSAFSRAPHPKKGIRGRERNLIISSVLLLGLWLAAFDVRALLRAQATTPSVQASMIPAKTTAGTCSSITNDLAAAEVKRLLGEPDEKRSHAETRGPGAEIWIYQASRCAVHIFDDRVEFIE
jgi:hypothetical protein